MVALTEPSLLDTVAFLELVFKPWVLDMVMDLDSATVLVMDTDTVTVTDSDMDSDTDLVMDTDTMPGHRPNGMEMLLLTLQMTNTPTLLLSM